MLTKISPGTYLIFVNRGGGGGVIAVFAAVRGTVGDAIDNVLCHGSGSFVQLDLAPLLDHDDAGSSRRPLCSLRSASSKGCTQHTSNEIGKGKSYRFRVNF